MIWKLIFSFTLCIIALIMLFFTFSASEESKVTTDRVPHDSDWMIVEKAGYGIKILNTQNNFITQLKDHFLILINRDKWLVGTFDLSSKSWTESTFRSNDPQNQIIHIQNSQEAIWAIGMSCSNYYPYRISQICLYELDILDNGNIHIFRKFSFRDPAPDIHPDNVYLGSYEFGAGFFIKQGSIYFPYHRSYVNTSDTPNGPANKEFGLLGFNHIANTITIKALYLNKHCDTILAGAFNNLPFIIFNNRSELFFAYLDDYKVTEKEKITSSFLGFDNGVLDSIQNSSNLHCTWVDLRSNNIFNKLFHTINPYHYGIYYKKKDLLTGKWFNEKLISKGIKYSFAPSIASEGNNVVIAWQGIESGNFQYDLSSAPNNIYYALSKDSGNTWTSPIEVSIKKTNNILLADPKIIIQNDTLHLFYSHRDVATVNIKELLFHLQKKL